MLTIALDEKFVAQLKNIAAEQGDSLNTLVETLIQNFLRETARHKMQREAEAFAAMHADLLARYPDQYVAIYQGQLVDQDADQLALYTRVEQNYPHEVVLIRQVRPEIEATYTVRSPIPNTEYRIPNTGI